METIYYVTLYSDTDNKLCYGDIINDYKSIDDAVVSYKKEARHLQKGYIVALEETTFIGDNENDNKILYTWGAPISTLTVKVNYEPNEDLGYLNGVLERISKDPDCIFRNYSFFRDDAVYLSDLEGLMDSLEAYLEAYLRKLVRDNVISYLFNGLDVDAEKLKWALRQIRFDVDFWFDSLYACNKGREVSLIELF